MIKVTASEMIKKHQKWIDAQPKIWARIMNSKGDEIEKKRRKTLESKFDFRSAGSKKYIMGTKGALYHYPTKIKALKQMRVVIGFKKNKINLKAWDEGGIIRKKDKKMDYTTEARGGNWRRLPHTSAKIRKSGKLPTTGKGSDRVKKMHQLMRTGKPFYMPATNFGGQKKRAGVYVKRHGKLIMLRGFAPRDTKIPKTEWHTGAVKHTLKGRSMAEVVSAELKRIYRKK